MYRNLSIKKYTEFYGPSRSKTYELIAEGKLQVIKYGSRTFVTVESAEAHRDALLQEQHGNGRDAKGAG